jgi:hypothetical protein
MLVAGPALVVDRRVNAASGRIVAALALPAESSRAIPKMTEPLARLIASSAQLDDRVFPLLADDRHAAILVP